MSHLIGGLMAALALPVEMPFPGPSVVVLSLQLFLSVFFLYVLISFVSFTLLIRFFVFTLSFFPFSFFLSFFLFLMFPLFTLASDIIYIGPVKGKLSFPPSPLFSALLLPPFPAPSPPHTHPQNTPRYTL